MFLSPLRSRPRPAVALGTLVTALATMMIATMTLVARPAQAAGFERGPDPTTASISADRGPFTVRTTTLRGSGFGGAQVYYPGTTAEGTYGVVAIIPGFTARWSQMAWLGQRIASQGFVVLGIDTTTLYDQPGQRARQFVAALNAAKTLAALQGVADFNRTAVAGWSMGGGGALDAAVAADYEAVIGIAPFEVNNQFSKVKSPTLIITGQSDTVAPAGTMGKPFYTAVQAPKAYVELAGGSHFFTVTPNVPQAASMISFLKRYVDDDTRYTQFLVPGPPAGANGISAYNQSGIS